MRLEVPILERGKDEHGVFALIEEESWPLADEVLLSVEQEKDPTPLSDNHQLCLVSESVKPSRHHEEHSMT